jgi:hypothetical protein
MEKEHVHSFKNLSEDFKKKAKKAIKEVDGIPYICYEWGLGVWGSCGEVDPNYKPNIPEGTLPGDVTKQKFCVEHHKPKFYYGDIPYKCKICGRDVIFSAHEQKHWFEDLHFHFDSFPQECIECRRKRREDEHKRVETQMAKKKKSKK